MNSTLTLPLKGEYFDQIKAGTKPEEFRLVTPYWRRRLDGRTYDPIELTRGFRCATTATADWCFPGRGTGSPRSLTRTSAQTQLRCTPST